MYVQQYIARLQALVEGQEEPTAAADRPEKNGAPQRDGVVLARLAHQNQREGKTSSKGKHTHTHTQLLSGVVTKITFEQSRGHIFLLAPPPPFPGEHTYIRTYDINTTTGGEGRRQHV